MEKFPVLNLIARFGNVAAIVIAAVIAVIALWLCFPAMTWLAVPVAAVAALIGFVVVKSYVEIVVLITEMLVPR